MENHYITTKAQFKNALITLMEQQDLHTISVVRLAECAHISRGTLYLHYKDMNDMICRLEQEVCDMLKQIVYRNIDNLHDGKYFEPILELANYIKENSAFIKVITSKNGDPDFIVKIKKSLARLSDYYAIRAILEIPDNVVREAYISFMISGGIGVFEEWIASNFAYSADSMINSLIALLSTNKKED